MLPTPDQAQHVQEALARLEQQGLSAEMASQAQACVNDLFALLNQYQAPALVALGAVVGVLDGAPLAWPPPAPSVPVVASDSLSN